jgi:signal transduction histidine kinase
MNQHPEERNHFSLEAGIIELLEKSGIMGSVSVDANGEYSDGLGSFIQFLGGMPTELYPSRFLDIVYIVDRPKCSEILKHVATTGELIQDNLRFELCINPKKLVNCNVIVIPAKLHHPSPHIRFLALPEKKKHEISSRDLQNHKLLNIGALSTAIAHDLSNLHTGILSFTGLITRDLEDGDLEKYVKTIEETIHRANELTGSILQYARGYSLEKEVPDPLRCIESVAKLAKNTLNEGVSFTLTLPKQSIPIAIQRTDLCQIFLNLFFNAKDAIDGKGCIKVSGRYEILESKKHFILEVEDDGPGISSENLYRIFDPFFTTKEKMNSSGLGLAIIDKIVKKANGDVRIETLKGVSTCFSVYLPTS